jgi:sulfur transfer protein SufE
MTKALRAVSDDKLRYQQLMFLSKKLGPMEQVFQVDGNKVPGCQSIVYIHATADPETKKVSFLGASDAILTKGLVAMLVNGLSDCTAEEIEAVNPEFIMYAGVGATLTPGRNNGFLNMLATMKKKAWEAVGGPASAPPRAQVAPAQAPVGEGPVMASMRAKLSQLQPSLLHVKDDSAQHAGHAGTQGLAAAETHFSVQVRVCVSLMN